MALFFCVLTVFASVQFILFFALANYRDNNTRTRISYRQLAEIEEVRTLLSEQAILLGLILVDNGDVDGVESLDRRIRDSLERWESLLQEETVFLGSEENGDTGAEKTELQRIDDVFARYSFFREAAQQIIDLKDSGRHQEAVELYARTMSDSGLFGKLTRSILKTAALDEYSKVAAAYATTTKKHGVLRTMAVAIMLFSIAVMALTYALIGRRVLHSLNRLERSAREYRQGEFSYVLDTRDEIGSLSRAIDFMTRKINTNTIQLEYAAGRVAGILDVVDRVSNGTYGPLCRDSGGDDIFDRLSRGINEMIEELLSVKADIEVQRDWLDLTLGSLREGIISTDTSGKITYINEAAALLTGWCVQEAKSSKLPLVFRISSLEDGSFVELQGFETKPKDFRAVDERGRFRLTTKSGEKIAIEAGWSPILDSEGKRLGSILIFHDITKLLMKDHEVKSLREKIIRQEKLSSMGMLAAGIAHEINNPIGYIESNIRSLSSYADKLKGDLQKARPKESESRAAMKLIDGIHETLADIRTGMDRITKIVAGMSVFSRSQSAQEPELSDINALVLETVIVVESETRYVAEIQTGLGAVPKINCVPGQIHQVLLNVILNSSAAIEKARHESRSTGRGLITINTDSDGKWVYCRIADSGPGIEPSSLPRVFEPFFTTKEPGEGTGLGMYVSYNIMKDHGGDISAENRLGSGAVVTLKFPTAFISPEKESR